MEIKSRLSLVLSNSSPHLSSSSMAITLFLILLSAFPSAKSGDADALLSLKASIDPLNVLQWRREIDVCKWEGVKECLNGRITKLVVENMNLSGTLDAKSLNLLDQLRVLSFKKNSLSGKIPELLGLANLKSLFLNSNRFSGEIPAGISRLHRLKAVVLSDNTLSGFIPNAFVDLSRLYMLYLQDNQLSGVVPQFSQNSLRFFNVSNNQLSGEIPETSVLSSFNASSFLGNNLCGDKIQKPCVFNPHGVEKTKLVLIIALSVGAFSILCIVVVFLVMCLRKKRGNERDLTRKGGGDEGGAKLSWDEGLGSLVFVGSGDGLMSYGLEDLLKASAETLGRGTMGSTYKAVMESGCIVTVKRFKEWRNCRMEEFRRHIEILGRLRHPNLVPLRAYYQAEAERLIVYDYFPNGSLFSLVHGTSSSGSSKPLHWTSCLKIAEDLAAGLVYIHQNPGLTHGNLKSTNVLLGSDFESCITDYGLTLFQNPDSLDESSASSLFYRAPECRDPRRAATQQADIYSYGVLLLELLTGKTPFQDMVQEHRLDIPNWVQSVRQEEASESGDEASEAKLGALLNIAMACVCVRPENRPEMRDVLRMVREVRAEAQVSPHSSDHSPGRWSDTVQSCNSREDHSSI